MKHFKLLRNSQRAFTLIELLVVIVIIGVLAALIFQVAGHARISRARSVAYAELNALQTEIDNYKAKYNFYPPDNTTNAFPNSLFYELKGTTITNNGSRYTTLDGASEMQSTSIRQYFDRDGFINASISAVGTDDRPAPVNFLRNLKENQVMDFETNGWSTIKILVCSATRDAWHYRSANPTNNPGQYDLWVDIHLGGNKRNRISNWSRTPQPL